MNVNYLRDVDSMANQDDDMPAEPRPGTPELVEEVYQSLRALARRYLNREGGYHTLQPTALVNEAYLRMLNIHRVDYAGKTHFFATAARQMRRVLVEHARAAGRQKRGGGRQRVSLHDEDALTRQRSIDVLALEEALEGLMGQHPRQCRVAELRLFGGLTVAESAVVLSVGERTIKKDWRFAKAWLARELDSTEEASP